MTKPFIAYFRVSTEKQGRSGLGLEAQKRLVADYLTASGGHLVAEYVEVQSGRALRREKLDQALAACQRQKAHLIVAKLDRLSRRVSVIASMMESGVPFTVATMPQADAFQLHIYAALAEQEARMISSRTKDALKAAKARGVRLGNPRGAESIAKARAARSGAAAARTENLAVVARSIQATGAKTLAEIAKALEARGVKTAAGKSIWHPGQVARLLAA